MTLLSKLTFQLLHSTMWSARIMRAHWLHHMCWSTRRQKHLHPSLWWTDVSQEIDEAKQAASLANSTATQVNDALRPLQEQLDKWQQTYGNANTTNDDINNALMEANKTGRILLTCVNVSPEKHPGEIRISRTVCFPQLCLFSVIVCSFLLREFFSHKYFNFDVHCQLHHTSHIQKTCN